MRTVGALIKRNIKLFFKDKALFFTSLITPLILLVLYATFLAKTFRLSYTAILPADTPQKLIAGAVGGQLFSSLLAVSCVTVAFCSNMLMVTDKVTGARNDMLVSPVRPAKTAIAYYIASVTVTLIVCFAATAACLVYLACVGWYMRVSDILLTLLDVLLMVLFGVGLSSVINHFLTSQGQISAVGTVVSAGYGFICGAYMPISMFGKALGNTLMFLPGTYGTSLLRNHAMGGVIAEMQRLGIAPEAIAGVRDSVDANLYFFGHAVPVGVMYAVVIGFVALCICVYVLLHNFHGRRVKK